AGILRHLGDALGVKAEHLVAAQPWTHELGPAVAGELASEEFALPAEFLGLCVHVIYELVDQRDGDLLHLGFGIGDLADEYVAGRVDAAFGISVEQVVSFRRRTGSRGRSP